MATLSANCPLLSFPSRSSWIKTRRPTNLLRKPASTQWKAGRETQDVQNWNKNKREEHKWRELSSRSGECSSSAASSRLCLSDHTGKDISALKVEGCGGGMWVFVVHLLFADFGLTQWKCQMVKLKQVHMNHRNEAKRVWQHLIPHHFFSLSVSVLTRFTLQMVAS